MKACVGTIYTETVYKIKTIYKRNNCISVQRPLYVSYEQFIYKINNRLESYFIGYNVNK